MKMNKKDLNVLYELKNAILIDLPLSRHFGLNPSDFREIRKCKEFANEELKKRKLKPFPEGIEGLHSYLGLIQQAVMLEKKEYKTVKDWIKLNKIYGKLLGTYPLTKEFD